jgi:hypothetical protein
LNLTPNALAIPHHFASREADHLPPFPFQISRSLCVRGDLIVVMFAVDLDDEFARDASEVRKITADLMLSAKLDSIHAMRANEFPANAFR